MKKKGKISTVLVGALKSSKLLKAIKLIKLINFAKPFITILSIAISIFVYAFVYSPWLAIGLVAVIFVHEMGHVIAMNKEGYKTNGPVFIPFVGAALFAPKGMDRRQEAVIGIGGPLLGSLFSFLLVSLYYLTDAKWLL
jgi:Zn-dependent protease